MALTVPGPRFVGVFAPASHGGAADKVTEELEAPAVAAAWSATVMVEEDLGRTGPVISCWSLLAFRLAFGLQSGPVTSTRKRPPHRRLPHWQASLTRAPKLPPWGVLTLQQVKIPVYLNGFRWLRSRCKYVTSSGGHAGGPPPGSSPNASRWVHTHDSVFVRADIRQGGSALDQQFL